MKNTIFKTFSVAPYYKNSSPVSLFTFQHHSKLMLILTDVDIFEKLLHSSCQNGKLIRCTYFEPHTSCVVIFYKIWIIVQSSFLVHLWSFLFGLWSIYELSSYGKSSITILPKCMLGSTGNMTTYRIRMT